MPARLPACLLLLLAPASACGGDSAPPGPTPTGGRPATPIPPGWTLVFDDEFDVPGPPDPARWNHEIGYIANDEKQYYTPGTENARVEDGALVIEARRERRAGYDYTSARLNTRGRAEFLYGRVEVRAKLPTGRGTWPALWMLGASIDQVDWPACGEIDIMENVGFDPQTIVASVHTAAYNHTQGTQKNATTKLEAPWADFHAYAVEWHPDRIDAFVDDQKYFTFRNEGTGSRAWPFDKPQFLILNLAIGGTWGGQKGIDDSLFPHRLSVDYVRVYQRR
ncbi:MAG TPA: glycoside hydrolase family 16 protein [Vicinamibacteria bacterium]|nr:glycoside hydrolase family 16 protein [Vicinamibacteria bacterium]